MLYVTAAPSEHYSVRGEPPESRAVADHGRGARGGRQVDRRVPAAHRGLGRRRAARRRQRSGNAVRGARLEPGEEVVLLARVEGVVLRHRPVVGSAGAGRGERPRLTVDDRPMVRAGVAASRTSSACRSPSTSPRTAPGASRGSGLVLREVAADQRQVEAAAGSRSSARARAGTRTSDGRGPSARSRRARGPRGRRSSRVTSWRVGAPSPSSMVTAHAQAPPWIASHRTSSRARSCRVSSGSGLTGGAPVGEPRQVAAVGSDADQRAAARTRAAGPAVDVARPAAHRAPSGRLARDRSTSARRVASSTAAIGDNGETRATHRASFLTSFPMPASARWSSSASPIVGGPRGGPRGGGRASSRSTGSPAGRARACAEGRMEGSTRCSNSSTGRGVEAHGERHPAPRSRAARGRAAGAIVRPVGTGATSRACPGACGPRARCRTG